MDMLADVDMHGIQTSGNCIRNITSDCFAGIARRRGRRPAALLRDPAPVEHAASGVRVPAAQVQDRRHRRHRRPRRHRAGTTSACMLRKNDAGEIGFKVLRRRRHGPHADHRHGGARVPAVAARSSSSSRRSSASTTATAGATTCTRRASRSSSRPRGRSSSTRSRPSSRTSSSATSTARRTSSRGRAATASPRASSCPAGVAPIARRAPIAQRATGAAPAAYTRWLERNVHAHQLAGYRAVTLSLKRAGQPPGDATGRPDGRSPPTSPTASATASCASRTTRTWCCRGCARAICSRSGRRRATPSFATPNIGLPDRHDRLPRRRLLRARQRPLDPDRRGDHRALRRPRRAARHRRHRPAHQRLHQLVRPPPQRPHRHPRRRQGRARSGTRSRSAAPTARRSSGRVGAGQGDRPVVRGRRGARRDRGGDRHLSRRARGAGERFIDTVRRVGVDPFKAAANARAPQRRRSHAAEPAPMRFIDVRNHGTARRR